MSAHTRPGHDPRVRMTAAEPTWKGGRPGQELASRLLLPSRGRWRFPRRGTLSKLEEASTEQSERSDRGQRTYQNDSPAIHALTLSSWRVAGLDAVVVPVAAALSQVAHQLFKVTGDDDPYIPPRGTVRVTRRITSDVSKPT